MVKTLLVEDEYLIRELLKESVNFRDLGFEIVGEAEDGLQALKQIQELAPQLLILDINIPFINGVELAKIVKDQYPQINIIVLTGFEEFEYAREFIKIGVYDYVLKPIEPAVFREILVGLHQKLAAEDRNRAYLHKLEQEAENSSLLLRKQFVENLLEGAVTAETIIADKLRTFAVDMTSQRLCVVTIELDTTRQHPQTPADPTLAVYSVYDLVTRSFAVDAAQLTLVDRLNRVVWIVNATLADGADVVQRCQALQQRVLTAERWSVSVGLSGPKDGYSTIAGLYREALLALEEKFFSGGNQIYHYHMAPVRPTAKEPLLLREQQTVLLLLRTEQRAGMVAFLDHLRAELRQARPPRDVAYGLYLELYAEIMKYIWENNLTIEEIVPNDETSIQSLRLNDTVEGLNAWLLEIYDTVVAKVKRKSRSRSAQIVERAREFIEENYWRTELSIEEVAERIFINPSYLSKVFRRDMHSSMVEYLSDLRMQKAKEKMDQPGELSISEIAHQVGYSDPFYFSKLFKKAFGVSPSAYLERKHRR